MTNRNKPNEMTDRKPYAAPHLKVFGGISELTAGGSGPVVEAMAGGMSLMKSPMA